MSTRHRVNIPTWQYHHNMAREKIYPSESQDRYIVRFPDGMRDRIAEAAKANNRSMNSEIIARLEASFDQVPEKTLAGMKKLMQDRDADLLATVNANFERILKETLGK